MAGIRYYDKAEIYVGGERIGTALDIKIEVKPPTRAAFEATANPIPKPPRVEKWQRWRDSRGVEFTVIGPREDVLNMDTYPLRKDGEDGLWRGNNLLGGKSWTFLGYANPDKVEVGQRWQRRAKGVIQIASIDGPWATTTHGERFSVALCKCTGWEYLGMLESAELGARAATGEALDREAKHNEFVRSDGDTDERLRARFSMPRDPKIEARRANEEAAKRLIANPPEWAYPRAWTCAVLALQERANVDDHRIFLASGDKICAEMLLEECKRAHNRQPRIPGVVYDPIRDVLFDAYARGMERTSPLMGRPGVKGGVSTCDLGGEYE